MTSSPLSFPFGHPGPEALLAEHGAFLTALARALVRDSGAADDLAQETLIEALRHRGKADRPWLATVLRRKAANRFRSEKRRSERERSVARPEAGANHSCSAEQAEVVERLFGFVRELDEPQREAILGRFYHGLSYVELAREFGAPASTVQSRVQRGLETLRGRLDGESGHGRASWMGALGAYAGLERRAGASFASTSTVGTGEGGWLTAASWSRLAAVLLAVGAAGFAGYTVWSGPQSEAMGSIETKNSVAALGNRPIVPPAETKERLATGVLTDEPERVALHADVEGKADGFLMQIDETGQRVPAADVEVLWTYWESTEGANDDTQPPTAELSDSGAPSEPSPVRASSPVALQGLGYVGDSSTRAVSGTVTTNARGEFRLDDVPEEASCSLDVHSDDTFRKVHVTGILPERRLSGEPLELLRVPHGFLSGRAQDLDGRPLAGVTVSAGGANADASALAISDDTGHFRFPLRKKTARIKASLTGYVQVGKRDARSLEEGGWEPLDVILAREGTLEIDLGLPPSDGFPREIAVIESFDQHHFDLYSAQRMPHKAQANANGLVTLRGLPIGQKLVILTSMRRVHAYRRGALAVSTPFSHTGAAPSGTEDIVIPESGQLRLSLNDVQFHTLRGRVEDDSGNPAPGVLVNAVAVYAGGGPSESTIAQTETDERGGFSMQLIDYGDLGPVLLLVPGEATGEIVDLRTEREVEVLLKTGSTASLARGSVELPPTEDTDREPILRLMLLEPDSGLGPRRVLSERSGSVDENGDFQVELPVATGRYRLVATHPDFAPVEVEFDAPRSEPLPTLRFTERHDAELTVRVISEDGTTFRIGVVTVLSLASDVAAAPLLAAYGSPGGSRVAPNKVMPEFALRSRFSNLPNPQFSMMLRRGESLTQRVPSGPTWIGALALFPSGERGSVATGSVLVPPGASEVTLQISQPTSIEGRVSNELLAKGSGLRVAVRPAGAPLDLEVGRGPMGAPAPFIPIDRQGRFEIAVPSGTYECQVLDAAGSVLKRVTLKASLDANHAWVIE